MKKSFTLCALSSALRNFASVGRLLASALATERFLADQNSLAEQIGRVLESINGSNKAANVGVWRRIGNQLVRRRANSGVDFCKILLSVSFQNNIVLNDSSADAHSLNFAKRTHFSVRKFVALVALQSEKCAHARGVHFVSAQKLAVEIAHQPLRECKGFLTRQRIVVGQVRNKRV